MRILIQGMLALLILLGTTLTARADLLNTRPVAVGPSSDVSETSLQEFFDNQTGSIIDVANDQLDYAIWHPTSNNVSTVTLRLEEAGFESIFGIYKLGDPSTLIPVLGAVAEPGAPGYFSTIVFNAGGVANRVVVRRFDDTGAQVGLATTVDDFGMNFGFYLQHGILGNLQRFFSEDSLNESGNAHLLPFAGNGIDAGVFFLAFEDSFDFGNDHDYNDFVVGAESINPVTTFPPPGIPEPASMFLLATGLYGLARARRSGFARRG